MGIKIRPLKCVNLQRIVQRSLGAASGSQLNEIHLDNNRLLKEGGL